MPANLSQPYRNAEKAYRRASNLVEELQCLELMLREIPKHKGTDKLQADLKKRISQTKSRIRENQGRKSAPGFRLPRQGAARVVIVGGPNSGKSSLFNGLTGADSTVAEYPFTTLQPQPALMMVNDIQIQLIDTPPLTTDFDPRTESLVRGADLVLLLADLGDDEACDRFVDCCQTIQSSRTRLGSENGVDERNIGVTYSKVFVLWSQDDQPEADNRKALFDEFVREKLPPVFWPQASISTKNENESLQDLGQTVFHELKLIRVFTKLPTEKEIDRSSPVGLTKGSTVLDLAAELHEDLKTQFNQARVWGSDKHDGTVVNGDYILEDLDVIEIRTR